MELFLTFKSYILQEVIFIYKQFIKRYITKLTINDIKNFAYTKNENITDEEAMIIKKHILNYQEELLNGNINSFSSLKENLRLDLFNKIVILYKEYYHKYKNYLQN